MLPAGTRRQVLGSILQREVGRRCAQREAETLMELLEGLSSLLCLSSPEKDFALSTWLFIQHKYLLHLALETEVGHCVPIVVPLSLSVSVFSCWLVPCYFSCNFGDWYVFGCGVQKLWGLGQWCFPLAGSVWQLMKYKPCQKFKRKESNLSSNFFSSFYPKQETSKKCPFRRTQCEIQELEKL